MGIPDDVFYAQKAQKRGFQGGQPQKRFQGRQTQQRRGSIRHPQKCIWVGGLQPGITYQELKEHGEQAGAAKWAEVFQGKGKGSGVIGFGSEEEADAAASVLNGTKLKGGV